MYDDCPTENRVVIGAVAAGGVMSAVFPDPATPEPGILVEILGATAFHDDIAHPDCIWEFFDGVLNSQCGDTLVACPDVAVHSLYGASFPGKLYLEGTLHTLTFRALAGATDGSTIQLNLIVRVLRGVR
jgi:hypothetical protein